MTNDPGRPRPMPPARADGAPSVCLRCGERPTAERYLARWCHGCANDPAKTANDYVADWDAWAAHRSSPPPPGPRDDLIRRAVAILSTLNTDEARAWLHDYAKSGKP